MKKIFLVTILAMTLLFSGCGNETKEEMGAPEGASFSSFEALDLEMNAVDESIFVQHDLTMINIWATFCGPCLAEMPYLAELSLEYEDKGVQIIGIVADVQPDARGEYSEEMLKLAKELVQETGADYPHLLPGADLNEMKLYEVSAVPETIFVDREGNIVGKSYIGSRSKEDWAAILDSMLKEVAE